MDEVIREVNESDDFGFILHMVNDTLMRSNPDTRFRGLADTTEQFRNAYLSNKKGFVAQVDAEIVAFMSAEIYEETHNGLILYGVTEGYEPVLGELIRKCEDVVRGQGGTEITILVFARFGQVRNPSVSFWERFGFTPDEYLQTTLTLHLDLWEEPRELDTTRIEAMTNTQLDVIKVMLIEDGKYGLAHSIGRQFRNGQTPDQVILALCDSQSNEIAGLGLYRVIPVPTGDKLRNTATAFTLHFRPKFRTDRAEKRRLLQASLVSMRQLEIFHVISSTVISDFDVLAAMVIEGFNNDEFADANTLSLSKRV